MYGNNTSKENKIDNGEVHKRKQISIQKESEKQKGAIKETSVNLVKQQEIRVHL
jgi:hypothetical protein